MLANYQLNDVITPYYVDTTDAPTALQEGHLVTYPIGHITTEWEPRPVYEAWREVPGTSEA
jgi:hypothetical protein